MKIKRIYVTHAVNNLNSKTSFDCLVHAISYVKDVDGYLVDNKVLIPSAHVYEVLVEHEEESIPKRIVKETSKVKDIQ